MDTRVPLYYNERGYWMPYKILLIDDDPDIREVVFVILKSQGYEIIQAVNGNEGLAQLKKARPDLIILDLLMPSMDGFNVCKTLRSPDWAEYRDIPVLILTSVDEESSRQRYELETGLKLKSDEYVEKPVIPAVLIVKVQNLLGKR